MAADAQVVSTAVGVGAVSVRFADQASFGAATLTPSISLRSPRLSLAATATLSSLSSGLSRQGTASLSLYSPTSARGLLGELTVHGGGSAFPDGASTAQGLAALRGHWLGERVALWAGGGGGAMYDGLQWRSVRQAELGLSLAARTVSVSAALTPSVTDDSLAYTDLLGALSTAFGPVDVLATIGGRAGATLPIPGGDTRIWGGLTLSAWLASRTAVTAGVGSYPVDVTQGFPAGRYVTVGLRWGAARTATAAAQVEARRLAGVARRAGLQAFQVRRVGETEIEVRVRAPGAQRVQINGDLSRWTPVDLVQGGDGSWWARLPSRARVLELVVRVDGGPWLVPPGADEVVDEFGGRSGRLVLP